jgi:hypothetical protein
MAKTFARCLNVFWSKSRSIRVWPLTIRGEGIVVKKTASQYITNSRGVDWVKVKPEYADQMGEVSLTTCHANSRTWICWFWVGGSVTMFTDRRRLVGPRWPNRQDFQSSAGSPCTSRGRWLWRHSSLQDLCKCRLGYEL